MKVRQKQPVYISWLIRIWVLCTALPSIAQQHENNFFEASYAGGTSLKTTSGMREMMQQAYTSSFQITFGHQYTAEDYGPTSISHYYPTVGLSFVYSDFRHIKMKPNHPHGEKIPQSDYGHFFALAASFTRYLHCFENFRFKSIIENGIAYALDPYDYHQNPYSSIGGHFQIYFNYGLFVCYTFGKNEISIGPQFTHYSNSGTYRPNNGVNNISLALRFKQADYKEVPRSNPLAQSVAFQPYFYWGFHVNGGIHTYKEEALLRQMKHPEQKDPEKKVTIYGDLNVSVDFMYRTASYQGLGIGLDLFHGDGYSLLKQYYSEVNPRLAHRIKRTYLGVAFKNESYIKNFAINIHVGAYLNSKHLKSANSFTRIYERIGMKYYWGKGRIRPYVGYFIKGNLFTAEQFELCYGITFRRSHEESLRR